MTESIFTKIRKGEIPGELIYEDSKCFAILTIEPHNPGHILLVPIEEVADWQELDPDTFAYMAEKAQVLARAISQIYNPPKVGLAIIGFEVPHLHIHILSLFSISDIDHDKAKKAEPQALHIEADRIREHLKNLGEVE